VSGLHSTLIFRLMRSNVEPGAVLLNSNSRRIVLIPNWHSRTGTETSVSDTLSILSES